jgi:hypothetical protein
MKSSTYLIRFKRLILLGAVVTGIAVPTAGAYNGSPPDVRDAAGSIAGTLVSPPDVRDVAANLAATSESTFVGTPPDVRDVAANLSGAGSTFVGTPPDVRDAAAAANVQVGDVFERYASAHPYGTGLSNATSSTLVSRPPDVTDAAQAVRYGVSLGQSSSFHWGDWAIGIGSGIGLILILGSGMAMGLQRRHRMQTA